MGNWTDANLRNHISGDKPTLSFNNFFEKFNFINDQSNNFSTFVLKDLNFSTANIQYNAINNDKLEKHASNLKEKSPRYTFASTSNNKPMMDSYFAFNNVYLYQLILKINNIYNSMDYTNTSMKKILIPTKALLNRLLGMLIDDNYFKMTRELNNPEELAEAIENIIINADVDLELNDVISEKLYINDTDEVNKRMKSPLVIKYLSKQLSKLIYKSEEDKSEESLIDIIKEIISKLKVYVYNVNV